MRSAIRSVAVAGLLLLAARPAGAQIVYEFADNSGTAQTGFSAAVGSTLQVRVYIHELAGGAPTLNSDGGLGSGAVRVTFSDHPEVAAVQTAADVTPAVPPWAFGTPGVTPVASPTSATVTDASSLTAGVLPDSSGRILLGTFTFHALSSGAVHLTAVDPNPNAGYDTSSYATDSGFVPLINYDPLLQPGAATITVSPVPEPAALGWAAAAAAGLLATGRRRRAEAVPAA